MALATKEQIEEAYNILEGYNSKKNPDAVTSYTISVGSKRKMHTLWSFNRLSIRNPYRYIRNVDDNILDAVKKLIVELKDCPGTIEIDQDETIERAQANEFKFLTFGKYKDKNIDDLLEIDLGYCYYLYKKAKEKEGLDGVRKRFYLSKLDKYIIRQLYPKIVERYNQKDKLMASATDNQASKDPNKYPE